MCVRSWTLSLEMSLYLEMASKQHLTPIAASTTFSNDCRPVWTQPWCVLLMCVLILWTSVSWCVVFLVCVALYCVLLFHARFSWTVLCCVVSYCAMSFRVLLCCVPHTPLVCPDNQHDANRSTASHPEVRSTLCLKMEPLTTYSDKVGEGDSVGCDHTYLLCHGHTCPLNDSVLICPYGTVHCMSKVYILTSIFLCMLSTKAHNQ